MPTDPVLLKNFKALSTDPGQSKEVQEKLGITGGRFPVANPIESKIFARLDQYRRVSGHGGSGRLIS